MFLLILKVVEPVWTCWMNVFIMSMTLLWLCMTIARPKILSLEDTCCHLVADLRSIREKKGRSKCSVVGVRHQLAATFANVSSKNEFCRRIPLVSFLLTDKILKML